MRFFPWKCPECAEAAYGLLEELQGIARIQFDERGDADYEGYTEVVWDSQRTIETQLGVVTLLCPKGHDWHAKWARTE